MSSAAHRPMQEAVYWRGRMSWRTNAVICRMAEEEEKEGIDNSWIRFCSETAPRPYAPRSRIDTSHAYSA